MERTAFEIQADLNLWHTRVVAVRLDPKQFRFRLRGRLRDLAPAWTAGSPSGSSMMAAC